MEKIRYKNSDGSLVETGMQKMPTGCKECVERRQVTERQIVVPLFGRTVSYPDPRLVCDITKDGIMAATPVELDESSGNAIIGEMMCLEVGRLASCPLFSADTER